jgi:hypothetical protein
MLSSVTLVLFEATNQSKANIRLKEIAMKERKFFSLMGAAL